MTIHQTPADTIQLTSVVIDDGILLSHSMARDIIASQFKTSEKSEKSDKNRYLIATMPKTLSFHLAAYILKQQGYVTMLLENAAGDIYLGSNKSEHVRPKNACLLLVTKYDLHRLHDQFDLDPCFMEPRISKIEVLCQDKTENL